jgi:hypothetical protein
MQSRSSILVEHELFILPEHLSSPPVFSGVRVTRSLVLCVCFVHRCLSFFFWQLCSLFFFDLRILITSLAYSNSSEQLYLFVTSTKLGTYWFFLASQTWLEIRVITKLPNSEQSNKGKVKTHKYINRQNQSTTGKL